MNNNINLCIKFINSSSISTDDILPAKYKHMFVNSEKLSKFLFKNKYPLLNKELGQYQAIICNGTFGIGSSREQAVQALLTKGIKVIISKNFGRIFFRNAWNLGLIALQCIIKKIKDNDILDLYIKLGYLKINNKKIYHFTPPSPYMINIVKSGGIINYILGKKYVS